MPNYATRRQRSAAFVQRNLDYVVFGGLFIFFSLHWFTGFKALSWDAMDEFYPMSRFTVDTLRRGDLPWWNPYQYSGNPFFADPQSLIFTAFTPVGLIAGNHYTPAVFSVVTLLHLLVGGMALIAYARTLDNSPLQRIMAAMVFATAGVATSRLQHVPQILTYVYWMLLLWAGRRWLQRQTIGRWLTLATLTALILVNPNQLTLLGGIAIGALLLLHLVTQPARKWQALAGLAAAAVVGALIASPVLAAIFEFVQLSARSALTVADSTPSSLPLHGLLALVFPGIYGIGGWDRVTWMPNDLTEDWIYLGAGVVLLLLGCRSVQHRRMMLGIATLFTFFALFALGTNTVVYPWLHTNVPGFGMFRRPADAAYVVILLVALSLVHLTPDDRSGFGRFSWRLAFFLAGIATLVVISGAYSYAGTEGHEHEFVLNATLACGRFTVLAGVFLWAQARAGGHWQAKPSLVIVIASLCAIEMLAPARFREFIGLSRTWAPGQLYRAKARTDEARELVALVQKLTAAGAGGEHANARYEAAHAPLGLAFASAVSTSNTLGYSPMRLGAYHRIIGAPEPWLPRTFTEHAPAYGGPWFQAIGLQYVLLSTLYLDTQDTKNRLAKQALLLHENLLASGGERWLRLAGNEVWRLPAPNPPVSLIAPDDLAGSIPRRHAAARGDCVLLARTANSLNTRCTVAAPAVAVFSEIAYPGWYACVDGAHVPLQTAWGLLRALPLGVGVHQITQRFEPVPFWRTSCCDR